MALVTLITPLNRGLKHRKATFKTALRPAVTLITPLNRGLKLISLPMNPSKVFSYINHPVK